MNHRTRPLGPMIAAGLLGVTAAGAAAVGLFAPVIALGAGDLLGGALGSAAKATLFAVALLSLALAAAAAVAARMAYRGRSAGALIGFVLGAILVAAPAVASASGGWHPALAVSAALGAGIIGSLAVALPTQTRP